MEAAGPRSESCLLDTITHSKRGTASTVNSNSEHNGAMNDVLGNDGVRSLTFSNAHASYKIQQRPRLLVFAYIFILYRHSQSVYHVLSSTHSYLQ